MIIQCEQCQTKFKLDDSKVADKSIKVRCARCRHVFSVAGPQDSALFKQNVPVFQIEEDLDVTTEPALESTLEFEPDRPSPTDDDTRFSFPSEDSLLAHDQVEMKKEADAFDFDAFDFGDDSGDAGKPAAAAPAMGFADKTVKLEPAATPPKEEFGGLDFSGDDMFGDVVSTPPEEEASESISFDLGMEGFADSMGVKSSAAGGRDTSPASQDQTSETPFSLDDIDFGDELTSVAVQQVSTEELKPSQDLLFAPLATAQATPAPGSDAGTHDTTPAAPAQEEPAPLSITSRRKEGDRISGMLVFMGIIIAGLVIFYSYWGYVTLTEDKGTIAQEAGRITVRSVEATYIKNKKAGDLLVISGEAVNEYNKPRAAIQVKGIVYGANEEELASKIAFCGNPLTEEQLATLTMDKIEAAMANQFGDSLANMEVAPGDAIPFVIVLPKPAAGATDYGVEPSGSTVATAKEK